MKHTVLIFCVVVLFFAFIITFCSLWFPPKLIKESYAAEVKDDNKAHEKPAAFLDPIEDSVALEDKKTIFKVLKGYKEEVEKEGIESVTLPFSKLGKPETGEEIEEDTTAKEETKPVSEEYDKLEKPEFFLTIPTIAKETACVINSNGQVQGNVFFTTYFDFECSSIQVWRLTFSVKEGFAKDKKEWQITDKKIKNVFTNLNHLNIKPDNIYSFDSFEFTHDRIKVKYGSGYFVTLFAGDIPIGGILLGKGGFYYDPPKQLAIDDIDSDIESYQLMRFTGTKEEGVYKNGKTKLDNEPFENGFIVMHPDKFEEYIKLDQFKRIEDGTITYSCMTKTKKILDDIFPKGIEFAGIKDKNFFITSNEKETEYFSCGVYSQLYYWINYILSPDGFPLGGIREETMLINEFNYLLSTVKGGNIWGLYDSKEQRETKTRCQLEHDSKEKVIVTHETVECNVRKNKTTHADIKAKLTMSIAADYIDMVDFELPKEMKITAITDEAGFAIPYTRSEENTKIFPLNRLKKGDSKVFTFHYNGKITYNRSRGSLYSEAVSLTPEAGYLLCKTLDLLVKTPKPLITASVGFIADEWNDEEYNYAYWKSEIGLRHIGIEYGEYERIDKNMNAPEGNIPINVFYNTKHPDFKKVDSELENVMNWLETLYGKYPYPKLAACEKGLTPYSLGYPSLLLFNFSAPSNKLVAHEAGHQWWGNIVGWARMEDQWLSEGITEHQAANYTQAREKKDTLLKKNLDIWRDGSLKNDKAGPIILGANRLGESYWRLTYGKAPYVMNMLRMIVGEETFVSICRQFIKVFGFKVGPTTSDFVEIVSRTLGEDYCTKRFAEKDMNWFFNQWIYTRGIPEFAFAYKAYEDGGKWKAKCRIKMLNNVLFKIPARVEVYDKKKKDPYFVEILLEPKEAQEFEIDLKGEPEKLFFNKFDTILSKGTTEEVY